MRDSAPSDWHGWSQLGAEVWRYDGSSAVAGPTDAVAFLVSDGEFSDFRLRAEFWIEDDTNSGIFIRCDTPSRTEDLTPNSCYEINIWDSHPNQDFRTGSIVTLAKPLQRVDTVGRWNTYVIEALGDTITVMLNGQQTAILESDRAASGRVALQYAGRGRVEFRNLEIVELR